MKKPTPAEHVAAAAAACSLLLRKTNTRAKADHQWRCSSYTGELDKGPLRVVHDGWEHAKLSPLSPRTEIFPGSQNSKPTGEALSECDAVGGGVLTKYGAVTLPVRAAAAGSRRAPLVQANPTTLALLCLMLRPQTR